MAKKTAKKRTEKKPTGAAAIKVIEEPAPATEPVKAGRGQRVCSGCSKVVAVAAKVCPHCGTPRPEKAGGKTGAKRGRKAKEELVNEIVESKAGVAVAGLLQAAVALGGIDATIATLKAIKAAK